MLNIPRVTPTKIYLKSLIQNETAFVQCKYLFNSSRLLQDLIELVDMKNEEAAIIS
jgi:hypothetical protein